MKRIILFVVVVAVFLLLPPSVDAQRRNSRAGRAKPVPAKTVKKKPTPRKRAKPKASKISPRAPLGPQVVPKATRQGVIVQHFSEEIYIINLLAESEAKLRELAKHEPDAISEMSFEKGTFIVKLRRKTDDVFRRLDRLIQTLLSIDSKNGQYRDFPEVLVLKCTRPDDALNCEQVDLLFSRREKKIN